MTRARGTLTAVIVGALAAGALAGPAVAQQDMRSPDSADLAATVQRHRAHHDVRKPHAGRQPARLPSRARSSRRPAYCCFSSVAIAAIGRRTRC